MKLADNIAHKISYFNELDKMTKKFYSPSLSVLEERFLPLLRRLDECIEFIVTNVCKVLERRESYREIELYLCMKVITATSLIFSLPALIQGI